MFETDCRTVYIIWFILLNWRISDYSTMLIEWCDDWFCYFEDSECFTILRIFLFFQNSGNSFRRQSGRFVYQVVVQKVESRNKIFFRVLRTSVKEVLFRMNVSLNSHFVTSRRKKRLFCDRNERKLWINVNNYKMNMSSFLYKTPQIKQKIINLIFSNFTFDSFSRWVISYNWHSKMKYFIPIFF